jgi:hypothetical protein
LACAVYSGFSRQPAWITIVAICIGMIHAAIMTAFWLSRRTVRYRTALMIGMVASAMLTWGLAWVTHSNGMNTGALYGLALMHLFIAFFHPTRFVTSKAPE